jgi:hypothetical protein
MYWNANGALSDQSLFPKFLADHKIDTALINETRLKPTNKFRIPAYTIYRTEGRTPPHGAAAIAVKSSIHHNQATLP